jgi:hypothetical protein
MKRIVRVVLGIFSVVLLALAMVFLVNAFDETLTAQAKVAMEPLPLKPGYSLVQLRDASKGDAQNKSQGKEAPPVVVRTFQDYKKDPQKVDEALKGSVSSLKALLDAYDVGTPEEKSYDDFRSNIAFYPFNIQAVFLASVSQQLAAGQTEQAFAVLEKSNAFLKNLIQSPQSLLNAMIGLASLRKNGEFFASLQAEPFAAKIPESLRASFVVQATAEEIFANALKKEIKITSQVVMKVTINDFELSNINENQKAKSFSFKTLVYPALFRKNQTLNWIAEVHEEIRGEGCKGKNDILCSATYQREVEGAGLKGHLINPVGRGLLKLIFPRLLESRMKIEGHLDKLRQVSAAEPTL